MAVLWWGVRRFSVYTPKLASRFFFFLNDTAPPEISPLPHPAALPISWRRPPGGRLPAAAARAETVRIGSGKGGGQTAGTRLRSTGLPGSPRAARPIILRA